MFFSATEWTDNFDPRDSEVSITKDDFIANTFDGLG